MAEQTQEHVVHAGICGRRRAEHACFRTEKSRGLAVDWFLWRTDIRRGDSVPCCSRGRGYSTHTPPPPPGVFTTATAFSFQLASLPHRDSPATDVRADGLRLGSQARSMKRLTAAADGNLLLS